MRVIFLFLNDGKGRTWAARHSLILVVWHGMAWIYLYGNFVALLKGIGINGVWDGVLRIVVHSAYGFWALDFVAIAPHARSSLVSFASLLELWLHACFASHCAIME